MNPKKKNEIEESLISIGIDVISATNGIITFWFKENQVTYYPKRQWATGKGIKDGRGWKHLYDQIKPNNVDRCCPNCGFKLNQ